jgi:hypothetical protein
VVDCSESEDSPTQGAAERKFLIDNLLIIGMILLDRPYAIGVCIPFLDSPTQVLSPPPSQDSFMYTHMGPDEPNSSLSILLLPASEARMGSRLPP